jgi:putative membrane protein insertion efficiency factor
MMGGRAIVVSMLRFYKRFISPLLPAACRFEPTCSAYAREAVELHGVWRGGWLAAWRILRCNPFSKGGFDPVPCDQKRDAGSRYVANGRCDG